VKKFGGQVVIGGDNLPSADWNRVKWAGKYWGWGSDSRPPPPPITVSLLETKDRSYYKRDLFFKKQRKYCEVLQQKRFSILPRISNETKCNCDAKMSKTKLYWKIFLK
jgi:hypothetical protein